MLACWVSVAADNSIGREAGARTPKSPWDVDNGATSVIMSGDKIVASDDEEIDDEVELVVTSDRSLSP